MARRDKHENVGLELDESGRPAPPRFDGEPERRDGSLHLRAIHTHHRRQLRSLRSVFDQFEQGLATAEDVAERAGTLSMTDNLRRFGTLCGQECQALVFHHQIEDGAMYPQLQRSMELNAVIDRLMQEHQIVHAQIVALWEATRGLIDTPTDQDRRAEVRKAIERLERTVLSHFGYEEDCLLDAIDHFGVMI